MKKLFTKVVIATLAVALIFSLCCVSVFATHENPSEAQTELSEETNEIIEPKEDVADFYSEWINKITDSTLWINIGTLALACIGIIGTVVSKFKSINSLIARKADSNTLVDTVKGSVNDICNSFKEELKSVKEELDKTKENEEKLLAILTMFITNAKINPVAKSEIMNYLTGAKKLTGDVVEIVEKANEAIAKAEASEPKTETPALDSIVSEAPVEYMELG